MATEINLTSDKTEFKVKGEKFSLNLPGEFNVENALAAISVGANEGISLEVMSRALGKIKLVPGRMEYVENSRGLKIIVDYALTPDSLEKLYHLIDDIHKKALKNDSGSRVVAVLGSCGERDRGKRPIMGEIVARYADFVIVTNEDPYNEDPQQIIDEVFQGVLRYKKEGEDTWRIFDRRSAIKKALKLARRSGDIVVVTGKGAEEIMAIGEKRIPWNDKLVIQEELAHI